MAAKQRRDRKYGKPAPGSPEAVAEGCICGVERNKNGRGAYPDHKCGECGSRNPVYWVAPDCKVHQA